MRCSSDLVALDMQSDQRAVSGLNMSATMEYAAVAVLADYLASDLAREFYLLRGRIPADFGHRS